MDRVRQLREEKNMTQVSLGIKLGVSQETISGYENGRNFPAIENLLKLCEIFDVGTDYLLELSDIRKAATKEYLSIDEYRLIELYRALPKNKKDIALAFLQGQQ